MISRRRRLRGRSAVVKSSTGYRRRRLLGLQDEGGRHARIREGGERGLGNCVGAREARGASASARAGPAGPRCASMRERRKGRAGRGTRREACLGRAKVCGHAG